MAAAEKLPVSPAETLRSLFWEKKRERIRVVPVHTTRASSIGEECERRLHYERTQNETRKVYEPELQALFDLGNALEGFVLHEVEQMGVSVLQRDRDYFSRDLELSGHVDAVFRMPDGALIPAEVKGLNPYTADALVTIDDIRNSRSGWVRKYYWQLLSYLYFWHITHPNIPPEEIRGVFVLLNKLTGVISFVDCPLVVEDGVLLLEKATRIKNAVAAKKVPDRYLTADCQRCPFSHVCLPDQKYGEGVELYDHTELQRALALREEARKVHDDFSSADKAIKEILKNHKPGDVSVGDWILSGKKRDRKAFTAGASSWVQWEVATIGSAPKELPLEERLKASLNAVATKEK